MANRRFKLSVPKMPGESVEAAYARSVLRPAVQAAVTVAETAIPTFGDLTLDELTEELAKQAKQASTGDLTRMEAMLVSQSHTLDQLFHRLTRQALANTGGHPETAERYMKLALRAQAQCRANAEALHEMKHPKAVAFVQQANIAHGPQQVNNGWAAGVTRPIRAPARAGENLIAPDELLEVTDGERLDAGATGTATGANTAMEALATIHRATNASG